MNIILSTRNASKALQINAIFEGTPIKVLTLEEANIDGEAIEDGQTLKENALKKALFAHKPGAWAMADDTGIFIQALGGLPGVRSARWAGETATTEEITRHTLKQLEGKEDRSATFQTVVALIDPDGNQLFFDGEVQGFILETQRVPPQPQMPYGGIFVPSGFDLVWAQMSVEFENTISHRGIAFGKVRDHLKKILSKYRLNLVFTESAYHQIKLLQEKMEAPNLAIVIGNALAIYDTLLAETDENGNTIIIRDQQGRERTVTVDDLLG